MFRLHQGCALASVAAFNWRISLIKMIDRMRCDCRLNGYQKTRGGGWWGGVVINYATSGVLPFIYQTQPNSTQPNRPVFIFIISLNFARRLINCSGFFIQFELFSKYFHFCSCLAFFHLRNEFDKVVLPVKYSKFISFLLLKWTF